MQVHPIPQNIMQFEFKLVAGLTVKQLVWVAIGGGGAYVLYLLTQKGTIPSIFGYPLVLIVILITIVIALVPFQGRSADLWIQDYLQAMKSSTRRIWNKTGRIVEADNIAQAKPEVFPNYLGIYLVDDLNQVAFVQQEATDIDQDELPEEEQPLPAQMGPQPQLQTGQTATPDSQLPTSNTILVTPSTFAQYALDPAKTLDSPYKIAFTINENTNTPITDVVGLLKNDQGKTIQGLRSNKNGILFFGKELTAGTYTLEFLKEDYTFPLAQIVIDGQTRYPLIKVSPLS